MSPKDYSSNGLVDAIDVDTTVSLLQELVRIPSPFFEEAEISAFVYQWLDDKDLNPEYHTVSEPRITGFEGKNIIAHSTGTDPNAPTVLLNAHMDTVQFVDGWTENPTSGRIEDGKLYGQGACDMKGGLAAALVAFEALSKQNLEGDILFTAVVAEEGPFGLGTDALIQDGFTKNCDLAIVTEPAPTICQQDLANPAIVLGARGRFLYEINVEGCAAHGSQPQKGTNAAADAARIVNAFSNLNVGHHPQLGSGSICLLEINGGGQPLSVPDHCYMEIDRHIVPGETAHSVLKDAEQLIHKLDLESDVSVSLRSTPKPNMQFQPYVTNMDHPFVQQFMSSMTDIHGSDPDIGYFSTVGDFNHFGGRENIPTIIVGPDGSNIHGSDEYVLVDDVVDTARIVADATGRIVQ